MKRLVFGVSLVCLFAFALVASACGGDGGTVAGSTAAVRIDDIDPSSATIGDEITIRGSGFDPEANDIGFAIPHAQGEFKTAYVTGFPSPDGKTLRFTLPETFGACAFTQLGPSLACPLIGLGIPIGDTTVAVYNKAGTSNSLAFHREKSGLEAARDAIGAAPEMTELIAFLNQQIKGSHVANGQITKSYGYGVRQDGDDFYIDLTVHGVPASVLEGHVPEKIAGYEVRLTRS